MNLTKLFPLTYYPQYREACSQEQGSDRYEKRWPASVGQWLLGDVYDVAIVITGSAVVVARSAVVIAGSTIVGRLWTCPR